MFFELEGVFIFNTIRVVAKFIIYFLNFVLVFFYFFSFIKIGEDYSFLKYLKMFLLFEFINREKLLRGEKLEKK